MKFFSVSFFPEKKDINKKAILISIFFGNIRNNILSKLLLICVFICFAFFMNQYELIYYAFLSFIIVPKVADIITIFSQIEKSYKTLMSQRLITVDFYGDHIVYKFESTERFKGSFEKHYPFSSVKSVVDSSKEFIFSFNETDTLNIPKRSLNEESTKMINNLIENLFKSKYMKVDI